MSDPVDERDDRETGDADAAEAQEPPGASTGTTANADAPDAADPHDVEDTDATDDDSEWQFSLQDLRDREADREAAAAAERRRNEPLETGDPSLENTAFVLLGVLFALFIISRLFVL